MKGKLEEQFDQILINEDKKRKIIDEPGDSDWGQLILPAASMKKHNDAALKVVLIASYTYGILLTKALIEFSKRYPDKLQIVGLITDDPVSDHARISMKRRIWRIYDDVQRLEIEYDIVELAMDAGIPCYTGAVKTDFGHHLIRHWSPEVIEVCVFGQIIDPPIINYPEYGIYNFHPSDLAHGFGAGPRPFQDLIDRKAATSRFSVHHLTEKLDAGSVVGQSPDIRVTRADDSFPENLLVIQDKMMYPLDSLAVLLNKALAEKKSAGQKGILGQLDFERHFSGQQKKDMLSPVVKTKVDFEVPQLSDAALSLINRF